MTRVRSGRLTVVAVVLSAAVTTAWCAGCAPSGPSPEPLRELAESSEEPEDWHFLPGEEEAVLECATDKLGYELTRAFMEAELDVGDGPVDAEHEWERQRWMRAYEQCLFELPVDGVDLDDVGWQIAYSHGYALDPDGSPTTDDPLAPWAGREEAS